MNFSLNVHDCWAFRAILLLGTNNLLPDPEEEDCLREKEIIVLSKILQLPLTPQPDPPMVNFLIASMKNSFSQPRSLFARV